MRNRIIAGNWKMNLTPTETEDYIRSFLPLVVNPLCPRSANATPDPGGSERGLPDVGVVLIPPFTSLDRAGRLLVGCPSISLGAQDLHFEKSGAFTGEVSATMLVDCSCRYVLVGHSERRHVFGESTALIAAKLQAALGSGLVPILCVGETLDERRRGSTLDVLVRQLSTALAAPNLDGCNLRLESVVIAYEPVWAIGTGETASSLQAEETIREIRAWIASALGTESAEQMGILYGGSVKPSNTAELLSQPNIDGVLVGGASLKPDSFASIVSMASASRSEPA
ncbi:triose-phosphate isomerase [Candidatus Bipolaricaulota bacterium]|nr:triose-phosphate isomerase [Candidatus Bipolaricaulota bacterium]